MPSADAPPLLHPSYDAADDYYCGVTKTRRFQRRKRAMDRLVDEEIRKKHMVT